MTQARTAYVRNLRRRTKDELRLRFEHLLFKGLVELGFDVVEQSWSPDDPEPWLCDQHRSDDVRPVILYEHLSRNQMPDGDVYYMEMYLNGTFTLDRDGWGPFQASMRNMPDINHVNSADSVAYCVELSKSWLRSGESKYSQPNPKAIEAPQGYIFVPLQLSADDAIVCHAEIGVSDFLHNVATWAVSTGRPLVIKLHPYNDDPAVAEAVRFWTQKPNIYQSQENVHSLICQSAGVVTINSGCGFEALIHGKPVVTFGQCDYKWVTFAGLGVDLDLAAAYIDGYSPAQRRRAYSWVYYYLTDHVLDVRGENWAATGARLKDRLRQILFPMSDVGP